MPVKGSELLAAKSITKRYRERVVLEEVTLKLFSKTLTGLVGPNGAGKTTLLNILLGFDADYTGSVDLAAGARVAHIAQQSPLDRGAPALTVYEFIRIGLNRWYTPGIDHTEATLIRMLEHVGLAKTVLWAQVRELSGGEYQRLLIARALLSEPDILMLDEPLASVDYASRTGLYELLAHLKEEHNTALLLVSHDVASAAKVCDVVYCLNAKLFYSCDRESLLKSDHHH